MHKIIILILSSSGEIYSQFKDLQTQYLSIFTPQIKFFFIEFNEDQTEDVIEINNTLSFKGSESITPGMIIKTSLAINYLKKYEYDFIFRTNLSTVINMYNLITFINTFNLNENICSGFTVFGFITGTGIIMNKNVAGIIANNYTQFNYMGICEDCIISQILSYYNIQYIPPPIDYKWGMIIDTVNEQDKRDHMTFYITNDKYQEYIFDKNILQFRIKNSDRNIDILFFKDILKQLYNKTSDI
jgi:hypothetical protein